MSSHSSVVALVDLDGVLADFDAALWVAACERGVELDIDHLDHQSHRYMTDHAPRHQRAVMRELIEAPGWFRDLPVVPGARDGIDAMLTAGWEVFICTKPLEAAPTCWSEKAAWVLEHFPELHEQLIITPDKSLVHGTFLLDDAIKLRWLGRASWQPVVFTRPYNGAGSQWADLPHWSWGDPLDRLPGGQYLLAERLRTVRTRFVEDVT